MQRTGKSSTSKLLQSNAMWGEFLSLSLSLSLSLVSFLFVIHFFNPLNLLTRFCGFYFVLRTRNTFFATQKTATLVPPRSRKRLLAMTSGRKFTEFTRKFGKKFTLFTKLHNLHQKFTNFTPKIQTKGLNYER